MVILYFLDSPQANTMPVLPSVQTLLVTETVLVRFSTFVLHFLSPYVLAKINNVHGTANCASYDAARSTHSVQSPNSFCNPNFRNTYEYSILVYSCTGSTARACRNSATPSVHHGGRPFFYPASSLSAYCSLSQHQPHQQSLYP